MQSSRYGPGQRSLGASSSGQQKPAKGFWGKLKRLFQSGMLKTTLYYRRFRGVLWMGTTGFIFLIAPFAFSHFLEVSEELHQITRLGASEMGKM